MVKTATFHPIYETFQDVELSVQGAEFEWSVTLDLGGRNHLQLGVLDGLSAGTGDAAAKEKLGVHWNYLGHRYDRGWTRTLVAAQATKITFYLVDDPRPGIITSDQQPTIRGRAVTYVLEKDEALKLHDGRATISILSLNSYISVDAIKIEAL